VACQRGCGRPERRATLPKGAFGFRSHRLHARRASHDVAGSLLHARHTAAQLRDGERVSSLLSAGRRRRGERGRPRRLALCEHGCVLWSVAELHQLIVHFEVCEC
jgi:hypothetical protein